MDSIQRLFDKGFSLNTRKDSCQCRNRTHLFGRLDRLDLIIMTHLKPGEKLESNERRM